MGLSRTASVTTLAALLAATFAGVARADTGYEGEDLSLRLASAFVRFTEVSAFGGETAANRWSPAINPASANWTTIDSRLGAVLAGYGSRIAFDNGTRIDLLGEAGLWDTRSAGAGNLIFSQLRSNDRPDKSGLEFDYHTDTVQFQWAKRWNSFAAGGCFNYATSEVTQTAGGLTFRHSTAETYRSRVGLLYEPACHWLLGAVGEYAWSPFRFDALVPTGVGLVPISGEDTQYQRIARLAASYEYCEYCTVSADYQYGDFENDQGTMETHRFSVGVQHNVLQFLFLRAGATADQHGNVGGLAGVGAALGRAVMLDIGYQYDTLPELTQDFGHSSTLQVTLSVRF
jgi:hypothetical protein